MFNFKIILPLIVLIQLIIISFLAFKIFTHSSVLGESTSVIPLKKEDYIFDPNGTLKYFYELNPNSLRTDQVPKSSARVTYKINSESLNDEREFSGPKDENTFRIVTLGDSFTFGLFVNPYDNYSKKLEKLLNENPICPKHKNFEVINLGVPGYDIQYSVERFKLRGEKLNPDLVIWLIKNDDFFYINEIMKKRSAEIKEEMIKSGEQKEFEEKGLYFEYSTRARKELIDGYGQEAILNSQSIQLQKINDYYQGRLLIFSMPSGREMIEKKLSEFSLNRKDTYYYDDFPDFPDSNYLFADGHPDEKGHNFIAQNLSNFIKRKQLISCN